MRFLILNTDYPEFLRWFYAENPGLEAKPYDQQMSARIKSLFGVADFYSSNLRQLGHEAWAIHLNNEALQRAWAAEHGVTLPAPHRSLQFRLRRHAVPWVSFAPDQLWMYLVLAAQIRHYRPDVILNLDLRAVAAQSLKQVNRCVRFVIGQCASPLAKRANLRGYDLMISSLPNFVERFRRSGLRSELHRLGFEPRVLTSLEERSSKIPVSFVGTVSRDHRTRVELLGHLCCRTNLRVWGYAVDNLPESSPIRARYEGRAWGREMYQILRDSRITVNQHIDIAEDYANNLRLFEATGVGTLLVTDAKRNLAELFEPGKEVVSYRNSVECAALVEYYLTHDEERTAIARAGQQRTLREHTYEQRMRELMEIIKGHLVR
jgi:spore maturation protein CgeB